MTAISEIAKQVERPFPAYPHLDRYFPGTSIEDARHRLSRTVERGDGPGLLIGASGTGKSLLLQVLSRQFGEQFDVVTLACAQLCTRRALLQAIMFEAGLSYHFRDEGELRLTLLDHLLPSEHCPHGMLLLVDEAQSLPVRLLEELRMLTNVVRDGNPRVRLVLAGSPLLEESLADPDLESFQQRIAARCYLAPLGQIETRQYVRAHLGAVGANPDEFFNSAALAAVHNATDGVPRLINQLCDRALLLAADRNCPLVDQQLIQEAWADLQQLPTPWETEPAALAHMEGKSVVEFGGLSDLSGNDRASETDATETDGIVAGATVADQDQQSRSERFKADISLPDELDDAESDDKSPKEPEDEVSGRKSAACKTTLCETPDASIQQQENIELPEADATKGTEDVDAVNTMAQSTKNTTNKDVPSDEEGDAIAGLRNVERTFRSAYGDVHTADPFGESFEEEEVVLNQFGSLGDAFPARTPRVECPDKQLAVMVNKVLDVCAEREADDELLSSSDPGPIHDTTSQVTESTPSGSAQPRTVRPEVADVDKGNTDNRYQATGAGEAEATHEPSPTVTIKYPGGDETDDIGNRHDEPTEDDMSVPLRPNHVGEGDKWDVDEPNVDNDDEDILVVEHDPGDVAVEQLAVQRQEYSQLFAKLRRG